MALVRRSRSAGVPVLATLAAATLAVAVTVVALTFAGSLHHLLTTPALYGQSWDFETEAGDALKGPVLRQLRSDPAIAGIATGAVSPVEIGSHEVAAYGFDDVAGAVPPVLLAGRAPRGQDETALGTKTMDQFHLHLGDAVRVHSGASGARLRIVGTVVLPTTKFNKLGEGALFSFAVLHRIQPGTPASSVEIRLAPGADRSAVLARLGRTFDGTTAVRPTEVGDFGGVEAMPFLIALVFGAAAAAALAHALLVSIRRRRRDLAVLGEARDDTPVGGGCRPALRGSRRRAGLRLLLDAAWCRAHEHGRPAGRTRRPPLCHVSVRGGNPRRRGDPAPGLGALLAEVEQHRLDATVHVLLPRDAELGEDRVHVLLDRPLRDHE
jgi:hypothetical protein